MLRDLKDQIRPALVILVLLTVLTGVAYPAIVTVLAQGCSAVRRTPV